MQGKMDKQHVNIRRPVFEDVMQIYHLFEATIQDANIITQKKNQLMECIEFHGTRHFFMLAEVDGKIIGTIDYQSGNKQIQEKIFGELVSLDEIGTVYVLPDYQNQDIESILIDAIKNVLCRFRNVDKKIINKSANK